METLTGIKTLYSRLICSESGEIYDKNGLQTYSHLGKPLLAAYDWDTPLDRRMLLGRENSMWRYREILPVEKDYNIISLGEGMTPLRPLWKAAESCGQARLLLKDEAGNPTGSFKARGLSVAVSKAKELGVRKCVIPTAGNAGGALSAYCARAGLEAHVYMPRQTPEVFQKECILFGARLTLVEGNISDCARRITREREDDWFDVSTLKEPFRLEGKKTMGYEIAEQLQWEVPDVILYPTGGGTGLIGIWKAFQEMERLGWIGSKRPRMVAVQVRGCNPIVRAFRQGRSRAAPCVHPAETIANGLRVPAAFGDELILKVLRVSGGTALDVTEEDMIAGMQEMARREGVLLCPEGAAVWKAYQQLRRGKWIEGSETVVLLNTGSGYKYMENF